MLQSNKKNGYKFTINDRGTFYDWYNAFFEVRFKLDLKTEFARGPGRGDTCHLSNLEKTLPD